jgi:Zn-dependent peptidase ImmA (M78 family)/DNA-binding XRE family transcriptional regulator
VPEQFNPSRLDVARKRRAISRIELARLAGISARSLTFYDRHEKHPSPATVERLAQVLRFPVDFFFGHDLEVAPRAASSFRALTTLTARERDQAESAAALALMLADWIDARFTLPSPSILKLPGIEPDVAATAIRSDWGLGERPIKNMIHLLEAHGVRVFSLTDDCKDMDAFSFWRGETPYVFLNTRKSAERGRMDAAHELGHLVLHSGKVGARGREAEHEANLFGASLLMPAASLKAEVPYAANFRQIVQAKQTWKVSAANLTHRMYHLKMLSEWQYRSLFIELGQGGYRGGEPDGIPRETSQVLAKVFGALRSEGRSMSDVAEELHLPPDELSKIVFGLVLVSLEGASDPGAASKQVRPNLRLIS